MTFMPVSLRRLAPIGLAVAALSLAAACSSDDGDDGADDGNGGSSGQGGTNGGSGGSTGGSSGGNNCDPPCAEGQSCVGCMNFENPDEPLWGCIDEGTSC